jgi:hypothetical protein
VVGRDVAPAGFNINQPGAPEGSKKKSPRHLHLRLHSPSLHPTTAASSCDSRIAYLPQGSLASAPRRSFPHTCLHDPVRTSRQPRFSSLVNCVHDDGPPSWTVTQQWNLGSTPSASSSLCRIASASS